MRPVYPFRVSKLIDNLPSLKIETAAPSRVDRRDFLKTSALVAGAFAIGAPAIVRGQHLNSKLNIACIGIGGKGRSDTDACAGENIIALCDVDAGTDAYAIQTKKYPDAKFYKDYRQMLDQMGDRVDAVTISTPDHMHAIIASAAMKRKKAIFCQKPLTQTIYEARYLREMAHHNKLVTQMGNQGSASPGLRRGVEVIQDGIIGQVHQVHVWTNRPVWPQAMDRPVGEDPIPSTLDWDVWIGPAPMRPYVGNRNPKDKNGVYTQFNWRGWQDFGTGALGDMACHTVNMPFRSLGFDAPTEIEAIPFGTMNKESYPVGTKIRFEFPKRTAHVPLEHPSFFHHTRKIEYDATTLFWYDGGQPDENLRGGHDLTNKPPAELTADIAALQGKLPDSGCLFVGEGGMIFSPDDYGTNFFIKLKGEKEFVNYLKHPAMAKYPERIPRNAHVTTDAKGSANLVQAHAAEWLAAIKANKPEDCYSRFDIAGRLVEIMLLGCVSLRAGRKIEWDAHKMEAKNCPQAAPYIRRQDRTGWALS